MKAGKCDIVTEKTHSATHDSAMLRQLAGQRRQLTATYVLQNMLPMAMVTYLGYPRICPMHSNVSSC